MAEETKLDWSIIKLVRCTGPTQKHKHMVGHILLASLIDTEP